MDGSRNHSEVPPIVRIEDLRIRYGKLEAVKGISFDIPRGEVFGFIGPNGAGKSSTIRVLATLHPQFSGNVTVCGFDIRQHPKKVRKKIGFVPDSFGVYDDLTTREYLHFFAAAYDISLDRRDSLIRDVLELTDLTTKLDSSVDSLSRGMKQRLSLARVLIHDPELLLLDEPTSGLDPRARIEVRELLKELKQMGKTILISSHILEELAHLCTRIGIIEAGEMVVEGPLSEIYRQLDLLRVIHLQLVNSTPETLSRISQFPGVRSVEQELDRVSVKLSEELLSIEDFCDRLHQEGIRIRMFQPEAMDMETAFMKLTAGKVT